MKITFKEFVTEVSLEHLPFVLYFMKRFSISRQDAERIFAWYAGDGHLDDDLFDVLYKYYTGDDVPPEDRMPLAIASGDEDDPEGWMLYQISGELRAMQHVRRGKESRQK